MITQNQGKQLIPLSPVFPVISFRFWSADCPWHYVATTPAEGNRDLYLGLGEKGHEGPGEETGSGQTMRLKTGER